MLIISLIRLIKKNEDETAIALLVIIQGELYIFVILSARGRGTKSNDVFMSRDCNRLCEVPTTSMHLQTLSQVFNAARRERI